MGDNILNVFYSYFQCVTQKPVRQLGTFWIPGWRNGTGSHFFITKFSCLIWSWISTIHAGFFRWVNSLTTTYYLYCIQYAQNFLYYYRSKRSNPFSSRAISYDSLTLWMYLKLTSVKWRPKRCWMWSNSWGLNRHSNLGELSIPLICVFFSLLFVSRDNLSLLEGVMHFVNIFYFSLSFEINGIKLTIDFWG